MGVSELSDRVQVILNSFYETVGELILIIAKIYFVYFFLNYFE